MVEAFGPVDKADSTAYTGYSLAMPPAGLTATPHANSADLSWSPNGNPAYTRYYLIKSTDQADWDGVFDPAGFLTSPTTHFTEPRLLGCTTYYYRAGSSNQNGWGNASTEVVKLVTLPTIPTPAVGFSATSLSDNRIAFAWTPSPTEGITGYRLYWDNGTGSIDYGSPLAILPSSPTLYAAGPIVSSGSYNFSLHAVHRCGVEESTGIFASAGSVSAVAGVRAAIMTPAAGSAVSGNYVIVRASLLNGSPDQVRQIDFQYRPSGTGAWLEIPSADALRPNPVPQWPFLVTWNVSLLASRRYDLRAVAYGVDGSSDPAPGAVTISVDALAPTIISNLVAGQLQDQRVINSAITNTVVSGGVASGDPVVTVSVPSGAVSDSTVTMTVVTNPSVSTSAPAGMASAGSSVQIDLSNGQHQLSGGAVAAVTLSYPDNTPNAQSLQIYSLDPLTGGWTKDFNSAVDTASHTVTGLTPHFSVFALFYGVAATASDLSAVRVYPVPFKPNGANRDEGRPFNAGDPDSGIVFAGLPAQAKIQIFTMTGRLVAHLEDSAGAGKVQWDSRNQDGRNAASGGYFAVISAPGCSSVVKKLAILR